MEAGPKENDMTPWTLVSKAANTFHDLQVHRDIPILFSDSNNFPVATTGTTTSEEVGHIEVFLGGFTQGGVRRYTEAEIMAVGAWNLFGKRNVKRIWSSGKLPASESPDTCIAAVQAELDAAVDYVLTMDERFEADRTRIAAALELAAPHDYKTRAGYEAACAAAGASALTDKDCERVRFGVFTFPEYDATDVIRITLAQRRLIAMDHAKKAQAAVAVRDVQPAEVPAMGGQIWEPCERCGHEPVYLPLFLCAQCWPR
jgi:hypothetical protein